MDSIDRSLTAAVLASLAAGAAVGEGAFLLFRAGLVSPEVLSLTGRAASLGSPQQLVLSTPLFPSLLAASLGGLEAGAIWGILCGFASALLVLGFLLVLAEAPLSPGTKTGAALLAFLHPAVLLLVTTSPSGTLGLLFLSLALHCLHHYGRSDKSLYLFLGALALGLAPFFYPLAAWVALGVALGFWGAFRGDRHKILALYTVTFTPLLLFTLGVGFLRLLFGAPGGVFPPAPQVWTGHDLLASPAVALLAAGTVFLWRTEGRAEGFWEICGAVWLGLWFLARTGGALDRLFLVALVLVLFLLPALHWSWRGRAGRGLLLGFLLLSVLWGWHDALTRSPLPRQWVAAARQAVRGVSPAPGPTATGER